MHFLPHCTPPLLCGHVADEVMVMLVMSCLSLPADLIRTSRIDSICYSYTKCNALGKERGEMFVALERDVVKRKQRNK